MSGGFGYDPTLIERFPALVAGVLLVRGLANGPTPPELVEDYRAEQHAVAEMLAATPIAELPSIAAWRRTFSACGVKPTQHRVAAEALLRRLHKHGDVPNINAVVDLANLVSIRHALPVAVFDQAKVTGSTVVRPATGQESFTDLGSEQPVNPEPDEIVFVDDAGLVSARRWCWRQSAQSATTESTLDALITVEALHDDAARSIEAATADLVELLARYQPSATVRRWILGPDSGYSIQLD